MIIYLTIQFVYDFTQFEQARINLNNFEYFLNTIYNFIMKIYLKYSKK